MLQGELANRRQENNSGLRVIRNPGEYRRHSRGSLIWSGTAEAFLDILPEAPVFDLVVTSPPYNIGKEYETKLYLDNYLKTQAEIISRIARRLKPEGSICWQVGNYVEKGEILPLDLELHPIFKSLGLKLRNRIIWHFGHGLHTKRRFSGRYEVIMWYTKTNNYTFNLDAVRIGSKYPGKRHYKGPKAGLFSSNPLGKNPEDYWDFEGDTWDIPNVKSNHVEKTSHPCQFPVGLVERLLLALTNHGDLVFDPFCGVGTTGAAAFLHNRRFWGCELHQPYIRIAKNRIEQAILGTLKYRPHNRPVYDHTQSKLSIHPTLFPELGQK